MIELEFVDRYTGLRGIPPPWRACAPCQGLGCTPDDGACSACRGSRRRPLLRSLLEIPWRVRKALAFGWREVVRAQFFTGYPHLSKERMRSRRIAFRAMLADFV